jgi:serine O-acetyltransferase
VRRFWLIIYRAHQFIHGSNISHKADIAGEPCLPHGMHGVFISGEAKIGRNCVIFQHVTIGSNTLPDSKGLGAPVIGDSCYIGAGAKIIGHVRVGRNVRIGANAVVHRDVPDECVVVSGQQTVIPKDGLTNKFYSQADRWMYFKDGAWIAETDPEILKRLSERFPS